MNGGRNPQKVLTDPQHQKFPLNTLKGTLKQGLKAFIEQMPGYSHCKAKYWYLQAYGEKEKGIQRALQKAISLHPHIPSPFLMPKFKIYPLCRATEPSAFSTWLSCNNQN